MDNINNNNSIYSSAIDALLFLSEEIGFEINSAIPTNSATTAFSSTSNSETDVSNIKNICT